MEEVCARGDGACAVAALTAALHALHLYCVVLAATLHRCCAPSHPLRHRKTASHTWRWQKLRGVTALLLGAAWACGTAAATLRAQARVRLAAAALAPAGWLTAECLHAALWNRRQSAPLLYLFTYWLLSAATSAAALAQHFSIGASVLHLEIYLHIFSLSFALVLALIDLLCFYNGMITSSTQYDNQKRTSTSTSYKHDESYFYSKITFFWLNNFLYKGYKSPMEKEDLGLLPEHERSARHCEKFEKLYVKSTEQNNINRCRMLRCYAAMVWPNFYLGGLLKLLGDAMSLVPPFGLAVVVRHVQESAVSAFDADAPVTVGEFFNDGYAIVLIVVLCTICQSILSQSSTHLVTVEGIRLKTSLQGLLFEKSMRLAPYVAEPSNGKEEHAPLIDAPPDSRNPAGLLTNLVSQDTYNVMSCTWICHYIWTVPLKVILILYLLYSKLGPSAIVGLATSMFLIIPVQFYIGKKISVNSKEISTKSDHRISKMTEILQGINVIKLYVWEDIFKEKILNLREVELNLLKKDSMYWSFLTFSTQISTVVITVITFLTYFLLGGDERLTAADVFASLALFNQLSIPLLVLPVTVLMVIQAKISTTRISDFLTLPESNNAKEDSHCPYEVQQTKGVVHRVNNDGGVPQSVTESSDSEIEDSDIEESFEGYPSNIHDENNQKILVQYRDAQFSWTSKDISSLEIDDLQIPAGKLIMVVGTTGAGKSSLLSAVIGEMRLERGDVSWTRPTSKWYAGQPPWLLEDSVRDNIVMGGAWNPRRYARVLRATGLHSDLQLLPEGDSTRLGARGAPLSGGQRVRVCLARALYGRARLLALDEPLGSLDAALARHVVTRGLVPAARAGRTILLATNRLELLHYANMVIVMENGRVSCKGRVGRNATGVLSQWWRLGDEARAAAARNGVGPPGGTTQERDTLIRTLSRAKLQSFAGETFICGCEATAAGAHLLAEVPARAGGGWRQPSPLVSPRSLHRHLSSPPGHNRNHYRWRQDVRRTVSADATDVALRREASLLRRLMSSRPIARWTPKPLHRLLSSDSTAPSEASTCNGSVEKGLPSDVDARTENGAELLAGKEAPTPARRDGSYDQYHGCGSCWEWVRACGWWCAVYACTALAVQALAVTADCWLAAAAVQHRDVLKNDQAWRYIREYAGWSAGCALAAGCAAAACAAAGAAARRALHERLLQASLHATLHYHDVTPRGAALHRFSADVHVIDRKLPIAVSRWVQLALLCCAAALVNVVIAPWTLIVAVPAFFAYLILQNIYLKNARELQQLEANSAAPCVTQAGEARAGGATVRAGRLDAPLRARYRARLDHNHNVLLMLNATNRWLGLTMDLVGSAAVCVSLMAAALGASHVTGAGLAGMYSLLLPTYLAHLAKCRADLDIHLSAVARVTTDAGAPQEDYRDKCTIPTGWPKNGEIIFENVKVKHAPEGQPALSEVSLHIASGEKVAVCGRSGSGKSTLVSACVGGALVCEGAVRAGGAAATAVPLHALRHRLVVAPQEGALFSCTLRENLDPLAVHTDDEIWHSLRIVGLQEFVAAQPAGLECLVNVGNNGWSAGRAARAAAARAVLRAPHAAALLLDEPGAALDAQAERALLAAIAAALPHITILTVAHRVSSVLGYDRAVVLEGGRVVERGAPTALLADPHSQLSHLLTLAQRN